VDSGFLGLPDLQRPFVWSDAKVRDLLDSMMRGYPIGYLMLWECPVQESNRTIGANSHGYESPREVIIDGQQRLTSLYAIMKGQKVINAQFKPKEIIISYNPVHNKFEVANIYKEHAISKKKKSRPVDDFYELEKNRDFLFLQKLILNLEYENIVNRNLKKKNKDILYIANNYEEDDFKDDLLLNNKTINLCSNTVLSKNDLYKKINKICSSKISRNNSSTKRDYDNEDLISKQRHFEKDLLERRNIKFFHRYKNYMKNIKKEENRHYTLKIFNKRSIDQIIKSKNDLELDKLKYEYSNKIGSIEAKTMSGNTKHIRNKNKFEIKHKKYNSMNKKIKTALFNNEIGKLETQKYNIEDFIEL
jgi:hypothetical protein